MKMASIMAKAKTMAKKAAKYWHQWLISAKAKTINEKRKLKMAWRNESESGISRQYRAASMASISLAMSAKAKNNETRKRNKMWRNKLANGEMAA
jgi:ABC-type Fe3+ transport system substrate-binding protein